MHSIMSDKDNNDIEDIKRLLGEFTKVYFIKVYKEMSNKGIHPRQISLLELISKEDGLSQKEIAQKLNIRPPTAAVSVKRMERAGLLVKEADVTDKRISHIYITEKGRKIVLDLGISNQEMSKIIFDSIDATDIKIFKNVLSTMVDNINTVLDEKEIDEVMEEFKKMHYNDDEKHWYFWFRK